jgi:hypothetical protein
MSISTSTDRENVNVNVGATTIENATTYYKSNRISILKKRIINRAKKGGVIRQSTISNAMYAWTVEELSILKRPAQVVDQKLYVPRRTTEFVEQYQSKLSTATNNHIQLMEENISGRSHLYAKKKCEGAVISESAMINTLAVLVENDRLLSGKSETQKTIGMRKYACKVKASIKIYGTENILDIYVNPERFYNKLATSHLSPSSIKDYLSIFISFYRKSGDLPLNEQRVSPMVRELQTMVPLLQIKPLQDGMKRAIKLSKEEEMDRLDNAPSYRWEDIKLIPPLIARHVDATTLGGLRDQVIAKFYIEENVLRDNLGAIEVGEHEPSVEAMKKKRKGIGSLGTLGTLGTSTGIATSGQRLTTPTRSRSRPNFLNLRTKTLHLREFKTDALYRDFKLRISDPTMELVKRYLAKVEEVTGRRPTHLITKNDGAMYKDGKLSSYISDMFEKYTGAKKFTINDLRHSVATHHRNSGQRIKEYIAYMMHHSFIQHIRYERHSGKFVDFPVPELKASSATDTAESSRGPSMESRLDAVYLGRKVLVAVQSGRLKGSVLAGTVRLNPTYYDGVGVETEPSSSMRSYRYRIHFNDPQVGMLNTNLPNRYIVLA